jgi:hypothetical protein
MKQQNKVLTGRYLNIFVYGFILIESEKMAFLKKVIDKATFLLIVGVWTLASSYILNSTIVPAEAKTLIIGIGTLIIAWLGLESGNSNGNSAPAPAEAPASKTS